MNKGLKKALIVACLVGLTACGSTPKKSPQVVESKPEIKQPEAARITAGAYLLRAEKAQDQFQASIWYVRAADAYLQEQQPAKALALLSELNDSYLSEYLVKQKQLFQAEGLIHFEQFQQAYALIEGIEKLQGFEQRLLQAKATSAQQTQHYLVAIKSRIALKRFVVQEQKALIDEQIWLDLNQLEATALEHFQEPNQPELSGWLKLLQITRTHASAPANMLLNIKNWQSQYPSHPAALQLPQALTKALEVKPYQPQNIAVILPLTGKYQKQGRYIQQGIMAAFYELRRSHSPNIEFLDSNNLSLPDFIQTQQQSATYDFIIGPLLKSNVEQLRAAELPTPRLYLNDISQDLTLTDHQYSFALAPEIEAEQAAKHILAQGYTQPIVLAANNAYGQRMSHAFSQVVEQQTQHPVSIGFFSNTDEMQNQVENLLETAQSKDRIKTIKQLLGNPQGFEADARNRQDIDVIYIIGDPTQTRILKPYIDVNTAPFAELIPIFASSISFSSKLNNADLRDLNEIIFSDMPWILPGQANRSKLAYQMELVWENPSDALSRFFAFGFDAYQLITNLAQMRVFPSYTVTGLTGKLTVNQQGKLHRQLKWAKFNNGRVVNLVMK
ncbi:LppC family lipoprotein [Catenovulum agarivorans DS-2]|uniref:LppC family lipoprotein n=1 Tax=Catenovulum agarivorans DS-2 TaxID=1328313 RepID=W7QFE4_9ALTE|nr:penicillin-binding protein activator [Catenovulum agarivorans]EWH10626.1 LppC family lipoprotein [Catenovulum agarivorans DS-2]